MGKTFGLAWRTWMVVLVAVVSGCGGDPGTTTGSGGSGGTAASGTGGSGGSATGGSMGGTQCDGLGACVACLAPTDCAGADVFAPAAIYNADGEPDPIATADLNGDGRPDLVTANYEGNDVTVLLNTCLP